MEINQVKFGNYSIGNPNAGAKKSEGQKEEVVNQNAENKQVLKEFDVESMFNAMNIAAMQNKSQIAGVVAREVNPANYLSEERISDIEAMMAEFEIGVTNIAQSIEDEFPNVFSQAQKNALAASIYAAE